MIGLPFNDLACLGSITELVADMITRRDPVLVEIAERYPTVATLVDWIRSLPQRDDLGERDDGPKVAACEPEQRLRLPADDPNCVERAALYLALAELIDPVPARQLATLDTPLGLHTFPVENGVPVILDPRMPASCLTCGLAAAKDGPVELEARDAVAWTAQLAEAGAAPLRNGPARVDQAHKAMMRLVDDGTAPDSAETIDAMGWLLALAEHVAQRFGRRAIAIVRTTAQAIAELADEALARAQRNFAIEIGSTRIEPQLAPVARVAGRIGLDLGSAVLRRKLATLGIGDDMLGLVEDELNREGLSLGMLTRRRRLPTFEDFARRRVA